MLILLQPSSWGGLGAIPHPLYLSLAQFIMSLNLVLRAHGSVLATLPFLFHCSLPALPLGCPMDSHAFILSMPTSAHKGDMKAGFIAYKPALLLLGQEQLRFLEVALLETSTVSVTSHVSCNMVHCEGWSSLGCLGNRIMKSQTGLGWKGP